MPREMDHVWLSSEEFATVAAWYANRTQPLQLYLEPGTRDIIVRCDDAAWVIKRYSPSQSEVGVALDEAGQEIEEILKQQGPV